MMKKKLTAAVAAAVIAVSTFATPAVAFDKDDVITKPVVENGQVTPDSFWCNIIPWLADCYNWPRPR